MSAPRARWSLGFWSFFALLPLCVTLAMAANYDYAAAESARTLIRKTVEDIDKLAAKVGPVADAAVAASLMDTKPWQHLEQTSSAYQTYARDSLGIVDQQVKNLLDVDPAASLPTIQLPSLFDSEIARAKGALDLVSEERRRFQQVIDLAAKAKSSADAGRLQEIVVEIVDLPFVLLPNLGEPELGPIGILKDWYNRIVQLRDFGNRQIAANQLQDNIRNLRAGAEQGKAERAAQHAHLSQIWKGLLQHKTEIQKLDKEVQAYRERWRVYAEAAARRSRGKAIEEVNTAPPPAQIKFRDNWYGQPIKPIEPGEISSGADSHIAALLAAYDTVIGGGDIDAMDTVAWEVAKRRYDESIKLREKATKAREDLHQALLVYIAQSDAIHRRASAQLSALSQQRLKSDEFWRRWHAIHQAAESQRQALLPAVKAAYRASDDVTRAQTLHSAIYRRVEEAHRPLAEEIGSQGRAASTRFSDLYREAFDSLGQLGQEQYGAYSDIPSRWDIEAWQRMAANIDSDIPSRLAGGTDATTLKTEYRNLAASLREKAQRSQQAIPEFQRLGTEMRTAAGEHKQELLAFVAEKGALMTAFGYNTPRFPSSWGGEPPAYPEPRAPWVEERLEWLKAEIERRFGFYLDNDDDENPSIKLLKQKSLTQLAADFDAAASLVGEYEGFTDIYYFRRNKVVARLNEVSKKWFDAEYSLLSPSMVQQAIAKLDEPSPWAGLSANLDTLAANWEIAGRSSWAKAQLRPRLDMAVRDLANRFDTVFRDWRKAQQWKGFASVDAAKRKELRDDLTKLQVLVSNFNNAVGGLAGEASGYRDKIDEAMGPVDAVLAKMPSFLRKGIQADDQRFRVRMGNVRNYLDALVMQRSPLPEAALGNLETIFDRYEASFKEYQKRLREAEIAAEKQRKEWEAKEAERKRQEALARQAEEERQRQVEEVASAGLDRVRSLYAEFASAYSNGDVDGVIGLLADNWQGAGDAIIEDVQTNLDNSFRVFDRIAYRIQNLQIMPLGDGTYKVSYQAEISGEVRRPRLKHAESVNMVEMVGEAGGQLRILKTLSGSHFIRR